MSLGRLALVSVAGLAVLACCSCTRDVPPPPTVLERSEPLTVTTAQRSPRLPPPPVVGPRGDCLTHAETVDTYLAETLRLIGLVGSQLERDDFEGAQESYERLGRIMGEWGTLADTLQAACEAQAPQDAVRVQEALREMELLWWIVRDVCDVELAPRGFRC